MTRAGKGPAEDVKRANALDRVIRQGCVMWSRKRLDIGWADLLFGAFRVCFPLDRKTAARQVEATWPRSEHTLVCLSVRSGFDLLLGTLALPRGSEVLVSAITIPDIVQIIERHGLVPVPVDLDLQRMTPPVEAWRQAITQATRAILVAHLFGGRVEMTPLLELARQHRLLVFEDCAQAFAGTAYQGHPEADAAMFSFGTIKAGTALGGAILRIRDCELLEQMRTAQAAYPLQSRWGYFQRLAKCAALKVLSCRPICTLFVRACRATGYDYDRWINHAARGFRGEKLFAQIRRQPSSPLLAVLQRRLQYFDSYRVEQHAAKGKTLATFLRRFITCPGTAVLRHTYWVFPVVSAEPKRLIDHLAQHGFDATQGQSLCCVPPSASRPEQRANTAEHFLTKVVFLPFYPELPPSESDRMAAAVLELQPVTDGGNELRPGV